MITINGHMCGYCGACASACPLDAILVEAFIKIGDKCSNCGICVRVCPMGAREAKGEG